MQRKEFWFSVYAYLSFHFSLHLLLSALADLQLLTAWAVGGDRLQMRIWLLPIIPRDLTIKNPPFTCFLQMSLLYMGTNQDFFCFFLLSVLQHHEMLCEYICTQKPLSMAVETGNTEEGDVCIFYLLIRKESQSYSAASLCLAGAFGDTAVDFARMFTGR